MTVLLVSLTAPNAIIFWKKLLQGLVCQSFSSLHTLCNFLAEQDCPMNELCLTSSILYQTTIKFSDSKYKQKRYKGICEMTFKKRYANHKKPFNLINSKNDTTLSVKYWTLKQKQQSLTYMVNQRKI